MPTSFAGTLLGSGVAGFGGSSTNTNTNQAFNTNTSQTGTSSTQRTLTPYQTALQPSLFNYVQQLMTPGGATAALQPFQQQALDSTGLADMLRQQFMGTGGGNSGKFGSALVQGNLQRLGALQGVNTQFAQEASALPLSAASLASNLLGMNFGQTSSSSGTSSTSGTSTGSSSTRGSSWKI
jgi:hypothetical protein